MSANVRLPPDAVGALWEDLPARLILLQKTTYSLKHERAVSGD